MPVVSTSGRAADAVGFEPGEGFLPAVLRRLLAVARAVVGVEGVRRVRIGDDLRLGCGRRAGGFERGAHLFDGLHGNAGVGAAVETKYRTIKILGDVDRVLRRERRGGARERTVPGHGCLHRRIVRIVQPHDATAPAEAANAKLGGAGLALALDEYGSPVAVAPDPLV